MDKNKPEYENAVRSLVNKIVESEEALEIAKKLNLEKQVRFYEDTIALLEKMKSPVNQGFRELFWGETEFVSYKTLEEFEMVIPLRVLSAFQKAQALKMFDAFEVWVASKGEIYVLVGVLEVGGAKVYFKIEKW